MLNDPFDSSVPSKEKTHTKITGIITLVTSSSSHTHTHTLVVSLMAGFNCGDTDMSGSIVCPLRLKRRQRGGEQKEMSSVRFLLTFPSLHFPLFLLYPFPPFSPCWLFNSTLALLSFLISHRQFVSPSLPFLVSLL